VTAVGVVVCVIAVSVVVAVCLSL